MKKNGRPQSSGNVTAESHLALLRHYLSTQGRAFGEYEDLSLQRQGQASAAPQ